MFSKKNTQKKKNPFKNKGGINKGSVYVVVIMILLIFGGYILVGGTLPTKLPKENYNLVSLIFPSPDPASSSLQMYTFYGVVPTPRPIPSWQQVQPSFVPLLLGPSNTPNSTSLNLTNWKLQLPLGLPGRRSPTEIFQPELATFSIDPWYLPAQTSIRFRAAVNGITTSGSDYPRSELREMTNNGQTQASWTSSTGTHTLFLDQAITHYPQTKQHVVAGQLFAEGNFLIAVRLDFPKLLLRVNGVSTDPILDANYTLGTRYTIKFEVSADQTKVFYNGSATPMYTLNRKFSDAYFKTGAYTQSNCSKESICNDNNYGEVILYQVLVTHT